MLSVLSYPRAGLALSTLPSPRARTMSDLLDVNPAPQHFPL